MRERITKTVTRRCLPTVSISVRPLTTQGIFA